METFSLKAGRTLRLFHFWVNFERGGYFIYAKILIIPCKFGFSLKNLLNNNNIIVIIGRQVKSYRNLALGKTFGKTFVRKS